MLEKDWDNVMVFKLTFFFALTLVYPEPGLKNSGQKYFDFIPENMSGEIILSKYRLSLLRV